ncbi:hypothetical protein KAR91_35035, partial [Candidatus Pacearchaeota archaeon]|nr:hypothetical protein [Candidatus Pacearchaeota archaeon]
ITSGTDGRVRVSSDYGDSWFSATGCPNAYWGGCAISGSGKYMIVGALVGPPTEIYISNDFGDNFSAVSGTWGAWDSFAMSQDGKYRIGASDGYNLFTANAGAILHGDVNIVDGDFSIANMTAQAIPFIGVDGKFTEAPTDLFYDALNYFHTPKLAIFDDDAILKRGHGLSIVRGADADVDVIHVNTQSTSAYFRYDFSEDQFWFDKGLRIKAFEDDEADLVIENGKLLINSIEVVGIDGEVNKATVEDSVNWDTAYGWGDHSTEGYLTAETDPVFSAWDKSTGISIAQSQISDLNLTQGSIPFGAADGSLAEDNADLFWDGNLGLGLNTPARMLHMQDRNATFRIDRDTNSPAVQLHRFPSGDFTTPWKGFMFRADATGPDEGTFSIIDYHQAVTGGGDERLTIDTDGKIDIPGILESGSLVVNSIEVVGSDGEVNKAVVEDSGNWDTAYGWGDHSLVGYLTSESDPIFMGWDRSAGISITESQISDLQAYILSETDPIFSAWDKSTGISITESQISDLAHTPAFDGDIAEIFNSSGLFKIQPDAQGDVELFGDTDVGDAENGKIFYIRRQAAEGNDYIRFYVSSGRNGYIHSDVDLTLQGQNNFIINAISKDITFKMADNAGAKKVYFKDSDGNAVATIDSNGVLTLDKNNGAYLNLVRGTVNKINNYFDSTYTDLRFEGEKDYNRIGTWIDKPFQIVTNSINRVFVKNTGEIGIGIDPDSLLHLYDGKMRIEGATVDPTLLFTDNSDDDTWGFMLDRSEHDFHLVMRSANRNPSFLDDLMTFTHSHRVGIKQPDPTCELDVNGNTLLDGNLDVSGNTVLDGSLVLTGMISPLTFANTTEDKISLFEDRLEGTGMYGFGVESNTLYSKSPMYYRWYINANADGGVSSKMNLTATGLGLGTDDPKEELHIKSDHPTIAFEETDAASGERVWEFGVSGEEFLLRTANDLHTGNQTVWKAMNRGGTSVGLFVIPNAKFAIGTETDSGELTIDQSNASGGIPVLTLDQGDVDQPFVEFLNGTTYTGKSGQDQYLKVKLGANTRYLRLFN